MLDLNKDYEGYSSTSDSEDKSFGSTGPSPNHHRIDSAIENHCNAMLRKNLDSSRSRIDKNVVDRIAKRTKKAENGSYHHGPNKSPESILRKSALTFPNTPSIIRKRAPRGVMAVKSLERRLECAFNDDDRNM